MEKRSAFRVSSSDVFITIKDKTYPAENISIHSALLNNIDTDLFPISYIGFCVIDIHYTQVKTIFMVTKKLKRSLVIRLYVHKKQKNILLRTLKSIYAQEKKKGRIHCKF